MSKYELINAELRADVGKGASRRLRREGKIPAVLYGGHEEAVALTLEHRQILHAIEEESFFSSIQEIKLDDGRQQQVVVRDMHRHPYKQLIMHMDFMRVSATELLRMSVPLHFTGEDESPAAHGAGMVIQHQITDVEVEAMPGDLPEYIEVDLSKLDAGDAVMLSELKMPEGVRLMQLTDDEDSDLMVANVITVREGQGSGEVDEEDEDIDGEGIEGEGDEEADEDSADDDADKS
jgi:large subunit ribosomal protein L25